MPNIVACHQPNFLPWLGFFAKMARVDVFVLLDDVQFTRGQNRHNWTTRVRVISSGKPNWVSVPVQRSGQGEQIIKDIMSIDDGGRWLKKMLRTIDESYRKTQFYHQTVVPLLDVVSRHDGNVCRTNIKLIRSISDILRLGTEIVLSSDLSVEGAANQRLINLTKTVSGTEYLSGDGADDYQVSEDFQKAGIKLSKLNFVHPVYEQPEMEVFVSGLSIIDALSRFGAEGTRQLISPV